MTTERKGKKPAVKKPARSNQSRRSSRLRPWLILGVVLVLVGAYFHWNQVDPNKLDDKIATVPKHVVEKTGAGANIDFSAKTEQIHVIVDQLLQKYQATILDTNLVNKTVQRQSIEGTIKWSAREMPVALAKAQLANFQVDLKKILAKIDAELLQATPDHYHGQSILRLDIGVNDTLEGDSIKIIADKLYIIEKTNQIDDKVPPPSKTEIKAKLALIIDDFGYTKAPLVAYAKIDRPLTFAVLPNHPYTEAAAQAGSQHSRQIILHLPMEALSDSAKAEAQTINVAMSDEAIKELVNELTAAVPYIIGINNHQGSKATSNERVMKLVISELAAKGLFFIDSKTIGNSVAYTMAKSAGLPTAENQLFIDNSSDIGQIKAQLRKAGDLALQNGQMIAIGHARLHTAEAIQAMIPELESRGIRLVYVSTLLD